MELNNHIKSEINKNKQETIEEAVKRLCVFNISKSQDEIRSVFFRLGAEWQQERSYSEEDMNQFAFQCVASFLSNNENKVEMSLVEIILDRNIKKFEQFKNKL